MLTQPVACSHPVSSATGLLREAAMLSLFQLSSTVIVYFGHCQTCNKVEQLS